MALTKYALLQIVVGTLWPCLHITLFLLQLRCERFYRKVGKIPYLLHRTGPLSSLLITGFIMGAFTQNSLPMQYAHNILTDGAFGILAIEQTFICIYLIQAIQDVNKIPHSTLLPRLAIVNVVVVGALDVSCGCLSVGINKPWPRCVYFLYLLSVCLPSLTCLWFNYFFIANLIQQVHRELHVIPKKSSRGRDLGRFLPSLVGLTVIGIFGSLICIALLLQFIEGSTQAEVSAPRPESIAYMFFECFAVSVSLYFAWIPLSGSGESTSHSVGSTDVRKHPGLPELSETDGKVTSASLSSDPAPPTLPSSASSDSFPQCLPSKSDLSLSGPSHSPEPASPLDESSAVLWNPFQENKAV